VAHDEEYDTLVWLHTGRTVSVSPSGAINWAVETAAGWSPYSGADSARRPPHVLLPLELRRIFGLPVRSVPCCSIRLCYWKLLSGKVLQ
jgi:hypothetical protein